MAALLVVLYHFNRSTLPPVFDFIVSHGNEAVNFFFFLSGFVMIVSYGREIESAGSVYAVRYYKKRFARIYPIYFISLILVVLFNFWMISNYDFPKWRFILEASLLQSWPAKISINFPGWSLSVEWFFYLVFPLIATRIYFKKTVNLVLLITALYALNVFSGALLITGNASVYFFEYFPLLHVTTFIGGMIAAILFKRYRCVFSARPLTYSAVLWGLAFVAALIFYFLIPVPHRNNGWLLPVYLPCVLGLTIATRFTNAISGNKFVLLGDISYSVYILQYPLWMLFQVTRLERFFLLYIFVLVLTSFLAFKLIELPLQKYINRMGLKRGLGQYHLKGSNLSNENKI